MTDNGRVVAVGFFDGVHIGHAALLNKAKQKALETGTTPAVLSFDTHPDDLVFHQAVRLIGDSENREDLIKRYFGIEEVFFLRFDRDLMNMPWDDKKKMDMFDMLDSKWDFMKHFYSIMIRRVIGCRLNGYASVANLVAQQPKYHQYIHIFYCVLCYRQDSLGLTSKQMKTLEKRMEAISNIMEE